MQLRQQQFFIPDRLHFFKAGTKFGILFAERFGSNGIPRAQAIHVEQLVDACFPLICPRRKFLVLESGFAEVPADMCPAEGQHDVGVLAHV